MNIHPRIPRDTWHLPVPKPRQANPDTDLDPEQLVGQKGGHPGRANFCRHVGRKVVLKLGDFSKNPQLHHYVTEPNSPTL